MTGPTGIDPHLGPIGRGDNRRKSLSFAGDGVAVADAVVAQTRPMTLAIWFYPPSAVTGTLLGQDNENSSGNITGIFARTYSQGNRLWAGFTNYANQGQSDNEYVIGQWNFAALTVAENRDFSLFLNDVETVGLATSNTATGITKSVMGARIATGVFTTFFTGRLRNAYVFDSVLTASQIAQLRRETTPTGVSPVGHWPLLDGSGSVAKDRVGSSDATITNGVWI